MAQRRRAWPAAAAFLPGPPRAESRCYECGCERPKRRGRQAKVATPATPPPFSLVSSHLRRSDLAGWRTPSLCPLKEQVPGSFTLFAPVLKLRGLPYFCSKRHVMAWFGDLVNNVVDLLFISEVEPLNSGFALVMMDSSASALEAWQTLHKKPIIGKRFVEVFCLFPPHCPLTRRERSTSSRCPIPPPASAISVVPLPLELQSRQTICKFCGSALASHADGGVASLATERMFLCLEVIRNVPQKCFPSCISARARMIRQLTLTSACGLMHTAFLRVPALLYQDSGHVTRNEVDLFQPEVWQTSRFHRPARCVQAKFESPERVFKLHELEEAAGLPLSTPEIGNTSFFDLLDMGRYDTRMLLCEVAEILANAELSSQEQRTPPSDLKHHTAPQSSSSQTPSTSCGAFGAISVAEIGNDLSNRGRAYLFLTETKLRSLIEAFSDVFAVEKVAGNSSYYGVSLKPAFCQGPMAIEEMEAFQLTRRRRKGKSQAKPPAATPPAEGRSEEERPPAAKSGSLKLVTSISARSDYHNDPIATILRGTSATTRERVEALALHRALSCLDANTFDLLAGFAPSRPPTEEVAKHMDFDTNGPIGDCCAGGRCPLGDQCPDRAAHRGSLRDERAGGHDILGVNERQDFLLQSELRRAHSNAVEQALLGRRPGLDRLSTCPADRPMVEGPMPADLEDPLGPPLGIFANDLDDDRRRDGGLSTLTELFLASVNRR